MSSEDSFVILGSTPSPSMEASYVNVSGVETSVSNYGSAVEQVDAAQAPRGSSEVCETGPSGTSGTKSSLFQAFPSLVHLSMPADAVYELQRIMNEHSQMKASLARERKQDVATEENRKTGVVNLPESAVMDELPGVVPEVECQPSTSKGLSAGSKRPDAPAIVITSDTSMSEADDSLFDDTSNASHPFYCRMTVEQLRKLSDVKDINCQDVQLETNSSNVPEIAQEEVAFEETASQQSKCDQPLEEPAQASSTPYNASKNCSVETTNEADLGTDSCFSIMNSNIASQMPICDHCVKVMENTDEEEQDSLFEAPFELFAILQKLNPPNKPEKQTMQPFEHKTAMAPEESTDPKKSYQREAAIADVLADNEKFNLVDAASKTPYSACNLPSEVTTNDTELTINSIFDARHFYQMNAFDQGVKSAETMDGPDRKEREEIAKLKAENEKLKQAIAEAGKQAQQFLEQKTALANTLQEIKTAVQTERRASLAVVDELNKRVSDRESIITNQGRMMERSERKIQEKDKECENKIKIYLDEMSRLKVELAASEELAAKNRDTVQQQAMEIEAKNVLLVTSVDKWKSLTEQIILMKEKIHRFAERTADVPSSPEGQSIDEGADIVCPICNERSQKWSDMQEHVKVCVGVDQLDVM